MESPRWIDILPLLLLGLFVLSAAVPMVLLLAYRRTRAAGVVLVGVGLLATGLLFLWIARLQSDFGGLPVVVRLPVTMKKAPGAAASESGGADSMMAQANHHGMHAHGAHPLMFDPPQPETKAPRAEELAEESGEESAAKPVVQAAPGATTTQGVVPGSSSSAGRTVEQAVRPSLPKSDRNNTHEVRPAWVDAEPRREGDTYQMSITVGPYSTRLECDAQLPKALQAAVDAYVEIDLGPQAAGRVRLPAEELRVQLVKEEWEETIQASFGPMKQLHVLLQFDHKMRDRIQEARTNAIITDRLVYTGTGVGGGLLLLAILFAFLRLDQATGACWGRLALAALLAVAVVAAAAYAVAILVVA